MRRPFTVHVTSLGCPKNLVDTEVMCGMLTTAGFVLTDRRSNADVLLINTCSFIGPARAEADEEIRLALKWHRRRQRGRQPVVVVAGCLPQMNPEEVAEDYPSVDLFLGIDDIPNAAQMIADLVDYKHVNPVGLKAGTPTFLYDHTLPRLPLTPASYAYVKIADGCDNNCAYCTIPTIRGPHRSRDPKSVEKECRQLLDLGMRELIFIAQDITRFGLDRDDDTDLASLVQACDRIDGDYWLRLMYAHPARVTPDLVAAVAACDHVVPYLDMPVQHVATAVLNGMGRPQDGKETRKKVDMLRDTWPDVALRTTVIVGFPGETDAHFKELRTFIADTRFERLGVFCYSPEAGTPASASAADPVPADVAQDRRRELLEIQAGISRQTNEKLVGRKLRVIVDHKEGTGRFAARTMSDAPDVDNTVHVKGPKRCLKDRLVDVVVDDASEYDLEAHEAGRFARTTPA